MENVFNDIRQHRREQDAKWGVQGHPMTRWAAILSEENGEFAEASLQFGPTLADRTHIAPLLAVPDPHNDLIGKLRTEALHVAAVAVAIIEQIDREVEYAANACKTAKYAVGLVNTAQRRNAPIYANGYDAGVRYRRTDARCDNPHATDSAEYKEWQEAFDQGWSDEHFTQEHPC
jgi:hypothetical protein